VQDSDVRSPEEPTRLPGRQQAATHTPLSTMPVSPAPIADRRRPVAPGGARIARFC
jgi:hypothetical protein